VIAPVRPSSNRPPDDHGGVEFLASELLTWLWWRASEDARFVHPDGAEIWVHVDEHMEWRGERAAARRATLRAGVPGASVEARAALRSGKVVSSARFLLARGDEEVRFTLRGDDLDLSGVRLPAPEGDDAEERFTASLDALDRVTGDVDLVLRTFLDVRCSDRWDETLEKIRAFAAKPSDDERASG
jgi:hypothetical protein